MLLRRVTLFALLVIVTGRTMATAQIPDEIRIGGKLEMLFAEPLQTYLVKGGNLRRLEPFIRSECTASWRGYRASWEIRDSELLLIAVATDPCGDNPKSVPLEKLFPRARSEVPATWYSGQLVVPQGKRIQYVHMGYESRYEKYIVFQVVAGTVTSRREQSSRPDR